jgi:DNA repair ATPase RecN
MKEQVGELRKLAPTIEIVQKQTREVIESVSAIESRREFLEELRRRMSDLGALGSNLDERGRQLQSRMEAAEHSFVGLTARADEAERMGKSVATMTSNLLQAQERAEEIAKMIAGIETRYESIEEIAEQSQALKKELEQRQHVLKDAAKDLKRASDLRQEAAASAQQLDETAKRLAAALASADQRVARVGAMSGELEDRAARLQFVEKRLGQFEERLAKWDLVDQDVTRSLEQISARQGTVEALQADLDRMFTIAEKTAEDVRLITSAHREIAESRELLDDVRGRLRKSATREHARRARARDVESRAATGARASAAVRRPLRPQGPSGAEGRGRSGGREGRLAAVPAEAGRGDDRHPQGRAEADRTNPRRRGHRLGRHR